MTAYVCDHCGYRFDSAKDVWKVPCPYCGRNGVNQEKDASALLEDDYR